MEDILQPRIKAIIGLGNPGNEYNNTWHNLGFEVVDRLAGEMQFKPGRGKYYFCEREATAGKVVLLKPTTFMNRSGLAVAAFIGDTGFGPEEIMVICDDFNLSLGRVRLRRDGSDGGHKGLASVVYCLNSDLFPRLRLGIGPVPDDRLAEEFVLEKITEEKREIVDEMNARAAEAAVMWITEGYDAAAARFNRASDEN